MPTSTRTDPHRPSVLEPADYVLVGFADTHAEEGYTEWLWETYCAALEIDVPDDRSDRDLPEDLEWDGSTESFGSGWGREPWSCAVCGHGGVRYWTYFLHKPSGEVIGVGRDCATKCNLTSRSEMEHKQAREHRRILKIRERWMAVDQDREIAFAFAADEVENGRYGFEGMRHSFVSKIRRYGSTSDRFVRAIMRDMARTERREEEKAAQDAERKPVVEGRIEITGEVLSTKWQENDFGGREVMTVADDRGFLVWGSVPSAISNVERGDRVTFTATVEKSDRDECFGFFKRPSKADFIEEVANV